MDYEELLKKVNEAEEALNEYKKSKGAIGAKRSSRKNIRGSKVKVTKTIKRTPNIKIRLASIKTEVKALKPAGKPCKCCNGSGKEL